MCDDGEKFFAFLKDNFHIIEPIDFFAILET